MYVNFWFSKKDGCWLEVLCCTYYVLSIGVWLQSVQGASSLAPDTNYIRWLYSCKALNRRVLSLNKGNFTGKKWFCYGNKIRDNKIIFCCFNQKKCCSNQMFWGRRKVFDTESVRQGNCSTISGVVRLGFVGQLPCRSTSVSDNFPQRFVDRTNHFVVVTKNFIIPILTNDFVGITKPFFSV